MHVRVKRHVVHELVVLLLRWELAVSQQPGDLEKRGAFRQLLDRISPITQNSLVAIDEGDGTTARSRVEESWIVAYKTQIVRVVCLYFLEVRRAKGVVGDRNGVRLVGAGVLYLERAP